LPERCIEYSLYIPTPSASARCFAAERVETVVRIITLSRAVREGAVEIGELEKRFSQPAPRQSIHPA
jgi:hypothetical protein